MWRAVGDAGAEALLGLEYVYLGSGRPAACNQGADEGDEDADTGRSHAGDRVAVVRTGRPHYPVFD